MSVIFHLSLGKISYNPLCPVPKRALRDNHTLSAAPGRVSTGNPVRSNQCERLCSSWRRQVGLPRVATALPWGRVSTPVRTRIPICSLRSWRRERLRENGLKSTLTIKLSLQKSISNSRCWSRRSVRTRFTDPRQQCTLNSVPHRIASSHQLTRSPTIPSLRYQHLIIQRSELCVHTNTARIKNDCREARQDAVHQEGGMSQYVGLTKQTGRWHDF